LNSENRSSQTAQCFGPQNELRIELVHSTLPLLSGTGIVLIAGRKLSAQSERKGVVYVNGEYLSANDAKISVFDQGFLFGDGVFDTMIVKNGFLFSLDAHLDRLFRSAKAVMIRVPIDREQLKATIIETVRRSGLQDAYVKAIVTRGVGKKPVMGKGETARPTIVVFAVPPVSIVEQEKIEKGAVLISTTTKKPLDPRIKSLDYLYNMLTRLEAVQNGADEAISYDDEGHVTEAGAANIFIVKGRALVTPASGVLEGITREAVMEIAKSMGYEILRADLTQYDIYTADEVFICSTAGGIFPVTVADGREIGIGKVGKVTREILDHYNTWLSQGTRGTPIYKS